MKQIRYYQADCKIAVNEALDEGLKRLLIVAPGGTGKTFTAVNIIEEKKGRKLWINHEEALLEQSAIALLSELELMPEDVLIQTIHDNGGLIAMLRKYQPNDLFVSPEIHSIVSNIGVIKADTFIIDRPIVMASPQTLWKRLHLIPADYFSVLVADEADLFISKTFKKPLDYFECDLYLFMTATPFRNDGLPMSDICEKIVYEYSIEQAIADKYLTELNAIVIKTSANLDSVKTLGGDFNQKELTEKVNTPERNNLIVNKYIEYCSGQQFICFGVDVQHVIDLHEAFRAKGIMTEFVVSDETIVSKDERKRITKGYKTGEVIGLINHMIFAVGFDVRDTGCVIMACPTKSKRKFLQQLFRVTRLKTESFVAMFGQIGTILDITDGTSKHRLVNTHTLDAGKPIKERVFTSVKNKQLLLDAEEKRSKQFVAPKINGDTRLDLFALPKVEQSTSYKMQEPATEKQLALIAKYGYDIVNNNYTKAMCSQIISDLPAFDWSIKVLKAKGYDVSQGVTFGEYQAALAESTAREEKAKKDAAKAEVKNKIAQDESLPF